MCSKSSKDRIRNEYIWSRVGVVPINDIMREFRLEWFVRVQRRPLYTLVRDDWLR